MFFSLHHHLDLFAADVHYGHIARLQGGADGCSAAFGGGAAHRHAAGAVNGDGCAVRQSSAYGDGALMALDKHRCGRDVCHTVALPFFPIVVFRTLYPAKGGCGGFGVFEPFSLCIDIHLIGRGKENLITTEFFLCIITNDVCHTFGFFCFAGEGQLAILVADGWCGAYFHLYHFA